MGTCVVCQKCDKPLLEDVARWNSNTPYCESCYEARLQVWRAIEIVARSMHDPENTPPSFTTVGASEFICASLDALREGK